jgi:hypothetical protein
MHCQFWEEKLEFDLQLNNWKINKQNLNNWNLNIGKVPIQNLGKLGWLNFCLSSLGEDKQNYPPLEKSSIVRHDRDCLGHTGFLSRYEGVIP